MAAAVGCDDHTISAYVVDREIGRGGMGQVFLARHKLLGRPAAIKVLRPQYAKDRDLIERFFREAKIAANLRHPAITEVFDFGYGENGSAFIAMELLEGENLRARLQREGALGAETTIRYSRQLLSALAAAHERGIIHRDLKPENVFVVANDLVPGGEQLKLLDFGIAKLADSVFSPSLTQTGEVLGTPVYMAPEQCRGGAEYDGRTDLYALGCMMFEMLSGRPPFSAAATTQEIYLAHLGTPAPKVRCGNAKLESIIARLLQKEPEDRFESALDVLRVIDAIGDPSATQVALPPRMTARELVDMETVAPATPSLTTGQETLPLRKDLPVVPARRPVARLALMAVALLALAAVTLLLLRSHDAGGDVETPATSASEDRGRAPGTEATPIETEATPTETEAAPTTITTAPAVEVRPLTAPPQPAAPAGAATSSPTRTPKPPAANRPPRPRAAPSPDDGELSVNPF